MENLDVIRGYASFFFTMLMAVIFIAYIVHLYTSKKKGGRDYEKYGNLALDDEPTSAPIEPIDAPDDMRRAEKE